MSLVMAGLVVWGFSRTVDASLFHAKPARPLLLWMHGASVSTWVLFFIAQSALIRVRKVSVHRTLGWFGAGLATVMVGLGLTIAVVMTRFDMMVLHQRDVASFLSIPFWDMLVFGTCIALSDSVQEKPDTIGVSCSLRLANSWTRPLAGSISGSTTASSMLAWDLLIVLGVVRDLVIDGRLHKVYLYALPLLVVGQSITVYLWRANPAWWQAVTHAILGV